MRKFTLTKKALAIAAAVFAFPLFAQQPLTPPAIPKWTVQDGKLLDTNGNPFIFRGVTIDHTIAPEKTLQAIRDVAAAGANAAQIEFPIAYDGFFPRTFVAQLRDIIATCKESKLVCVLEANDAAGYLNYSPTSGGSLVSYWSWSDILPVLAGNQSHIIIGFGNQHFADAEVWGDYQLRMEAYMTQLLANLPTGYVVMIDGDNWGEDTTKAMLDFATRMKELNPALFSRIIYSVEMYYAYQDPTRARDYIAGFKTLGAPLVIGGFGPVPYIHPHRPIPLQADAPQIPVTSIMQYAEQNGVGYFGWSWSGNKNSALDIVNNYNPGALTTWGNKLFNDPNGIKATAKRASIFNNSSSSASSSSVPANQPPVAAISYNLEYVRCGQVYGNVSASGSSDPDGDALTYQWDISGYGSPITSTASSLRFYMQPPHYYTIKLTVSDGKGGVTSTSIVRNHTYSDYCVSSSTTTSARSSSSSSLVPSSSRSSSSSALFCPQGNSWPDCPFTTWSDEYCKLRGPVQCPRTFSSSSSSVSISSRSSSSIATVKASCSYVINSQWNNGFTASIRIKNTSTSAINGWDVNWQYSDGSKVTNLWNATLSGSNPYNAKNLSWNSTIQPGQTVEFGFQGSKSATPASVPAVTGTVCQ